MGPLGWHLHVRELHAASAAVNVDKPCSARAARNTRATSSRRAVFSTATFLSTGGFRVDGNSQFGKEVSPAWSVAIPITKISTTLRGSYSEGFRAPSFNELFFPGFGNPNLKPEISSEYDGGFTTNFGERASITATYFSRRVKNLIVTVPCKVGPTCEFGSRSGQRGARRRAGRRDRSEPHDRQGTDVQRQRDRARRDARRCPAQLHQGVFDPAASAAGGEAYGVGAAGIRAEREFSASR